MTPKKKMKMVSKLPKKNNKRMSKTIKRINKISNLNKMKSNQLIKINMIIKMMDKSLICGHLMFINQGQNFHKIHRKIKLMILRTISLYQNCKKESDCLIGRSSNHRAIWSSKSGSTS